MLKRRLQTANCADRADRADRTDRTDRADRADRAFLAPEFDCFISRDTDKFIHDLSRNRLR